MHQPPGNPQQSVRDRVTEIFRELVGQRAETLCNGLCASSIADAIEGALVEEQEITRKVSRDIGFHLSDWHSDAAFIVALHLFPERFTVAEIADGVEGFLIHAPNHVAAAAALYGFPVKDIFGVAPVDSEEKRPS